MVFDVFIILNLSLLKNTTEVNMSNIEHYFENILFYYAKTEEFPIKDDNIKYLSKDEKEAIEICAQYIIYDLCDGSGDKLAIILGLED